MFIHQNAKDRKYNYYDMIVINFNRYIDIISLLKAVNIYILLLLLYHLIFNYFQFNFKSYHCFFKVIIFIFSVYFSYFLL